MSAWGRFFSGFTDCGDATPQPGNRISESGGNMAAWHLETVK
jgi:hypothetical protein